MPKRHTQRRGRAKEIPHRNRDATGIWLASFLMRCEVDGEDLRNPRRRCLTWENTIILKAGDREVAYRKALLVGRSEADGKWYKSASGGRARWIFEGLTDLLPVYEELADGSELVYRTHHRSVKAIKALARTKKQLSVFRDNDAV